MIEIIMRIAYDRDLDHTDAPGIVIEYNEYDWFNTDEGSVLTAAGSG